MADREEPPSSLGNIITVLQHTELGTGLAGGFKETMGLSGWSQGGAGSLGLPSKHQQPPAPAPTNCHPPQHPSAATHLKFFMHRERSLGSLWATVIALDSVHMQAVHEEPGWHWEVKDGKLTRCNSRGIWVGRELECQYCVPSGTEQACG